MIDWFTSDLHLGHENIRKVEYANRPVDSVEEMNDLIISNWNSVVGDRDTVRILGDLAMGKIAETLPLVEKLNGNKILVPGNHDRVWFGGKPKERVKFLSRYEDVGLTIVANSVDDGCGVLDVSNLFIDSFIGQVDACHFPFYGDSHEGDRYTAYRPEDHGQWLLHGHTHSHDVRFRAEDGSLTKMIHIGVDAWNFTPVSVHQIAKIMAADFLAAHLV